MSKEKFPDSVIERLGSYVYVLIDPENEKVFYIGKGSGNRVFNHVNDALSSATPGEKLDRIRAILEKGLEVKYEILRHGLTEKEASEVEATLIDYVGMDTLTNQVYGINSDDRGKMSVGDIIAKYTAPEANISDAVILITVNQRYRRGMNAEELYEITRGDWVIGSRRDNARYAFAVYNGIIREVYEIEEWIRSQKRENRWYFKGTTAPHNIRERYVNHSTAKYIVLGAQNPIRYINC